MGPEGAAFLLQRSYECARHPAPASRLSRWEQVIFPVYARRSRSNAPYAIVSVTRSRDCAHMETIDRYGKT